LAEIHESWREGGGDIERHHGILQNLWSGLLLIPVTEALQEILAGG